MKNTIINKINNSLNANDIDYARKLIENDLKWIYAFMHKGDQYENFYKLEKNTLGALVKKLKVLDNSSGDQFISNNDYNFLKQMTEKRNFWCHQCFVEFMYKDDCLKSKDYKQICDRLVKDYNRLLSVAKNIENIRLEAIDVFGR